MPSGPDEPHASHSVGPAAAENARGTVASDDLVALVCAYHGSVPRAVLRARGFAADRVAAWVQSGVLTDAGSDHVRLASPDVYIAPVIQALWQVPDGIIAGLTALEYHGLSTVWTPDVCIAVAATPVRAMVAPSAAIQLVALPANLVTYGVEQVLPALPGTVAVAMYAPAVALAQVVADQDGDEDTVIDAVVRYVGLRGLGVEEREAAERYGVGVRLESLARPYTFSA